MPFSIDKNLSALKKYQSGDLPRSPEDWVKYVNICHEDGLSARKKWEFQWLLNLLYFHGYHGISYHMTSGKLFVDPNQKIDITINRVAAFVEARQAKLTKNRPTARTMPSTPSREDVQAAKYADQALRSLWETIEMEEEYDYYTLLGLITGTSFMRTLFDPFAGDWFSEIDSTPDNEIIMDGGEPRESFVYLGEISSRALSSFAIIPANESIPRLNDQPWIIERMWLPATEVKKYWSHIDIEDVNCGEKTEYEKLIERLTSPQGTGVGITKSKTKGKLTEEYLVKIMYMRPNVEYPRGVICAVLGDNLCHLSQYPHDTGKSAYPFAIFREKIDGMHFWGHATVQRLIPIQKNINKLKNKKLRQVYLMAVGKWALARGSQVPDSAITDEDAEVLEWNSAVPAPYQIPMAPLPMYAQAMDNELIGDFRDVGGQREFSQSPGQNLTASVAMETEAELTDEALGVVVRRLRSSMEITAQQQLIIMKEEYIEPRKIKLLGDDASGSIVWLSAADFKNSFDVRIDIESMMPDMRGAKRQLLFNLWDRRIIQDPQQFLVALRNNSLDSLMDSYAKMDEYAQLEILRIKRGDDPSDDITEFSPDHMTSFRILSEWIKTPEFLKLIPARKELALSILQKHMSFLVKSLPNQGEPLKETNQAAVGTPSGSQKPVGAGL